MIKRSIKDDLLEELGRLGEDDRRRVLDYARSLAKAPPKGAAGRALLNHSGALSEADAEKMAAAIEEGCEQVNLDAW